MSNWNHLPAPVQDEILFQLPVQYIIWFCHSGIFSCKEGITEFDEAEYFWKQYFRINPYNYIKYKLEKEGKIDNIEDKILIEASKSGSILAVKKAFKNGADIHAADGDGPDAAVRWADQNGHPNVVRFLMENGADIHAADQNGHLPVVRLLLDYEADALDDEALRWAARRSHFPVVRLLLDNEADIHALDDEELRWAARNGHPLSNF